MQKNIGKEDKIFRMIVAVGAVAAGMVARDLFYVVAGWLALTALVGFSPLYAALGKSTIKG